MSSLAVDRGCVWPDRQACDLTGFHQIPMEWRSTCTFPNTSSSESQSGELTVLDANNSDLATGAASASTGEQLPHTEDCVFCPQVCASPFRRRAPVTALMALKIRVASRCVSSIAHRVCEKTANLRIGHHSPKCTSDGRPNPSVRVSGTRSNSTRRSETTSRTHGEMIPILDL